MKLVHVSYAVVQGTLCTVDLVAQFAWKTEEKRLGLIHGVEFVPLAQVSYKKRCVRYLIIMINRVAS
jgi:glutamate formiminotransferase